MNGSTNAGCAAKERHPMRRRLSSRGTFYQKVVFPAFWAAIILFTLTCTVGALFDARTRYGDLIAFACFSVFYILVGVGIYMNSVPLKVVAMDDESLHLCNFRRTVRVPLAEVEAVEQGRWNYKGPIRIRFVRATGFGKSITFLPPQSWSRPLWPPSEWFKRRDHPVLKQLRAAVARARWLAVADAHTPGITGDGLGVKPALRARRSRSPRTDISNQGPGDIRKEDGKS
jgi:hypothetical protein